MKCILYILQKAAVTVNQKIAEYENTIQQKDELFIRDQNAKEIVRKFSFYCILLFVNNRIII